MAKPTQKVELLQRLMDEAWFTEAGEAFPWALAGKILVNDTPVTSLRQKVPVDGAIRIKEYYKRRYVNKGGLKLEAALAAFGVQVDGRVALDCGASTGGFTDCLVQHGAARVYAVDAGHGQLAGSLQGNERVVNLERTNLSSPALLALSPRPTLLTLDLSYLSLTKAVPVGFAILHGQGQIVALIKPIFETASAEARRTGEINDPDLLAETLRMLCRTLTAQGAAVLGLTHSPVRGNGGAVEFFAHLRPRADGGPAERGPGWYETDIPDLVERALRVGQFQKNRYADKA